MYLPAKNFFMSCWRRFFRGLPFHRKTTARLDLVTIKTFIVADMMAVLFFLVLAAALPAGRLEAQLPQRAFA
jgi:hypothetical protein